jgi:hypothetical protein
VDVTLFLILARSLGREGERGIMIFMLAERIVVMDYVVPFPSGPGPPVLGH